MRRFVLAAVLAFATSHVCAQSMEDLQGDMDDLSITQEDMQMNQQWDREGRGGYSAPRGPSRFDHCMAQRRDTHYCYMNYDNGQW